MSIRADRPYIKLLNEICALPPLVNEGKVAEAHERALALKTAARAAGLSSAQLLWTTAIAHDAAGELTMAFQDIRAALALDPLFPDGWRSYQIIINRLRAAVADPARPPDDPLRPRAYEALVLADEATAECHLAMARTHRHAGRHDEALRLAKAVTTLHPSFALAWMELAEAARATGDAELARQAETEAIAVGPNDLPSEVIGEFSGGRRARA